MITRREFLKLAGLAGVSTLVPRELMWLDKLTENDVASLAAADSSLASNQLIRLAVNFPFSWGLMTYPPTDDTSRKKLRVLEYFAALGYTHTHYTMHFDSKWFARNSRGRWVYNGGDYRRGQIAESLRAMKAAAEDLGLQLIPGKESLSHIDGFIAMDPSISEFRSNASFRRWLIREGIATWPADDVNYPLGSVAYVGPNPGMDDLCREYLKIVKMNWAWPRRTNLGGRTPRYYHIGHDEFGYGWSSCIKADRSKRLNGPKALLLAREIARRVRQVRRILGEETRVTLYGDGILPANNGEVWGLIGDKQTGVGGVLQLLRDRFKVTDHIVVMPWGYDWLDGAYGVYGRNTKEGGWVSASKVQEIAYLDRLGIKYIACSGEGGPVPLSDIGMINRTTQNVFEWVRATQMYPAQLVGFGHLGFNGDINTTNCDSSSGYCINYAASLLAYLAWTYGDRSLRLARHHSYGPQVFSHIQSGLSSQEMEWIEGRHYARPSLYRGALALSGY